MSEPCHKAICREIVFGRGDWVIQYDSVCGIKSIDRVGTWTVNVDLVTCEDCKKASKR